MRSRPWRLPGPRYCHGVRRVRAVLLDIDGVLTVSWQAIAGAVGAVQWLRTAGFAVALVTNTTSRTRQAMADALVAAGFPVSADDIVTAPTAAAGYLQEHYPGARCLLLNSGDISSDLIGVRLAGDGDGDAAVDVVLVGGAGPEFSYQALNQAFRHLHAGARLVVMSRAMYWQTSEGLQLDSGAFVAGLELAAHTEAAVVGKPAAAFFASVLARLGVAAEDAVMVGDDIEVDVLAAQRAGLTGVLVRTGKYQSRTHAAASVPPDYVVDSIADLPALLGR
jgi:HAD superfamily hydrolase (TIGR01458 family)